MAKQNPTPKARTTQKAVVQKEEELQIPPIVKQSILLLGVISCMFIILKLPSHKQWLDKVGTYYKEMDKQKKTMDIAQRMQSRHGGNYMIPLAIEKQIKAEDIFLLPPKEYILKTEKNPNNWSNPYVFYYMTDKVKTCGYVSDSLRKKATATNKPLSQIMLESPLANDSKRNKATMTAVYGGKDGVNFIKLENDSVRKWVETQFIAAIKEEEAKKKTAVQ